MTGELHQFDPDWTIAPAVSLRAWLEERGLSVRALAAMAADIGSWGAAEELICEVLRAEPLTDEHARVLELGTDVPARLWLNLERGYREDLAAGRADCSWE